MYGPPRFMYIGYGKYSCYHATWSWVALRYILRGCITPPKILRTVRPGNLKVKCRSGGSSVGLSLYFPVPYRVSVAVTARNRWCLLVDSLYNLVVRQSVLFLHVITFGLFLDVMFFRLLALRVISCLVRFFDPAVQTGTFWWGLRVVVLPLRSRSRLLLYPVFFRYVGRHLS